MNQNYEKLKKDLENLIDKFNKGWHEGIEIDASDIMLLNDLMEALSAITNAPTIEDDSCEAVAWQFYQDGKWHNGMETNNHKQNTIDAGFPVRELFTSPPKREWKSLSDIEISLMASNYDEGDWNDLRFRDCWIEGYLKGAEATQAKLKEVNGYA